MGTPKVSIITINYNNLAGLQATLDSVKKQTFQDYELLVIDGGSTDGGKEFLQSKEELITYWVSEPDNGIFHAQNKGIQKANGEYLFFLNSGDVLYNEKSLQEFLSHPNFEGDIVYGDYKYEKGEKIFADHITPYYFMKTSLPHQSTFFHKRVFDMMGGYDESYKVSADRAFYLKCFLSGHFKFQHLRYPLVIFDLQGTSNSTEFYAQKKEEDERLHKEFYGVYFEDMKALKEAYIEIAALKKQTPKGLLQRLKHKLFK